MKQTSDYKQKNKQYEAMIGVGGIGYGEFFVLNQNHTLGREESRSGHFIDQEDFCKLHIISHYVKTLLGSKFTVIPVGRVGSDEMGNHLISMIEETGMVTKYIKKSDKRQTLYSFCFSYPDGTGGNLTTDNSACDLVDKNYVSLVEPEFSRFNQAGIALAAPEVPLEARKEILNMATKYGFFRVASFAADEIKQAIRMGMFGMIDLLSINVNEASQAVDESFMINESNDHIKYIMKEIISINPKIHLVITNGKRGSWFFANKKILHQKSYTVNVKNSAGAGDAYLAGLIVGIVEGMPVINSHELGALIAAFSVTSPETIAKKLNWETLKKFVYINEINVSDDVIHLLKEKI